MNPPNTNSEHFSNLTKQEIIAALEWVIDNNSNLAAADYLRQNDCPQLVRDVILRVKNIR